MCWTSGSEHVVPRFRDVDVQAVRRQRQPDADHLRDLLRPGPGGIHHPPGVAPPRRWCGRRSPPRPPARRPPAPRSGCGWPPGLLRCPQRQQRRRPRAGSRGPPTAHYVAPGHVLGEVRRASAQLVAPRRPRSPARRRPPAAACRAAGAAARPSRRPSPAGDVHVERRRRARPPVPCHSSAASTTTRTSSSRRPDAPPVSAPVSWWIAICRCIEPALVPDASRLSSARSS